MSQGNLSQELGADASEENLSQDVGAEVLAGNLSQEIVAGGVDNDEEVVEQAEDIWLTVHATPPAKSKSGGNKWPTYDALFITVF